MLQKTYKQGGLHLHAGGTLVQVDWKYNRKTKKGRYVGKNVTKQAYAWLFSPVSLDRNVTLADVMGIVAKDPVLQLLFVRDFAKELCQELATAKKIKSKPVTRKTGGLREAHQIAYLELYHHWEKDGREDRIEGSWLLGMHGVGHLLRKDVIEHGHLMQRKGERINWSLSFMSPAELAHLPLRINDKLTITENRTDLPFGKERPSDKPIYGDVLHEWKKDDPTLGQVLHGVFNELSFHGAGAERDGMKNRLVDLAAQAMSAAEETLEEITIT